MKSTNALERFKVIANQVVSRRDAEIDLAEAALVIAAAEYPQLDIDQYLQRMEELSGLAETHLRGVVGDHLETFKRVCAFHRGAST